MIYMVKVWTKFPHLKKDNIAFSYIRNDTYDNLPVIKYNILCNPTIYF